MAITYLTTSTSSQQSITALGDALYVSRGVGITTNSINAIVANGNDTLIAIDGFALANYTTVSLTGNGVETVIGASGVVRSISSSGGAGIAVRGDNQSITNHGQVSGKYGIAFDSTASDGTLINYGSIASTANQGTTIGGGVVFFNADNILVNFGEISSAAWAINLKNSNTSGNTIQNFGTVSGDVAIEFQQSGITGTTIQNTGTLTGLSGVAIQNMGDMTDVNNSGLIVGDITAEVAGVQTIKNSGTVQGDIFLDTANDIFDGRGGIVTGSVSGGLGDDIYYVDNTSITLFEDVDQGTDRVFSAADVFILGENFENLTLLGGDTNGIGNSAANNILGSVGDNVIRGNAGTDTVNGGGGDDIVFGHDGGDEVLGGGGRDILRGGGEADEVRGGNGADQLFGGTGNDDLFGGNGRDMLKGGLGRDTMQGGNGADTFVFDRVNESSKSKSDVILDFTSGEDIIDLSGLSADLSFVGGAAFSGTGAEVRATVNGDGDTLIRVDADGNGSTDMKIVLDVVATIEAFDILL